MATRKFQRGTELIKQAAESKGGGRRFTPNIFWKPGDVKTIAFATEAEQIPKVLVHQVVRIPDDRFDSGFRIENIICKKDPSMIEEFGGSCELCDEVKHDATERFVALAVELEPIKDGKKVTGLKVKTNRAKNKDGVETDYPQWGLVMQASSNFFSYFAAYSDAGNDIREVGWEIQREGGSRDTKYHPFIVMNGPNAVALPDLSEVLENVPSLDELLEGMASEEKYAEVAGLDPGTQISFGGKNKTAESGTVPSGDRQTEFERIREELNAY